MQYEDRAALRALLMSRRQAALGTLEEHGAPFVSMVLYALQQRQGLPPDALIHVSRLSVHTRQLLADPRASLLVALPDTGTGDPQALARVTLQCRSWAIAPDHPEFAEARDAYLARLPEQEYLFGFPDFLLVRLQPQSARYIGGFAKAFSLSAEQLAAVLGT
jgi:hypothetical protein